MTQTLHTTLLIIGGGPGGYVAAIRAGQLGIPTILVEGQALGGTCLNIGCIPSKALIHVAEQFHQTQKHNQYSALGITVAAPSLDISKSVEWKDGIVDRLTTGVAALLKKSKVKVIKGWAHFTDAKTCTVKTADGADMKAIEDRITLLLASEPAYAGSMIMARVMGTRDSAAAMAFWGNLAFLACAAALALVFGWGGSGEGVHPSLAFLTRGWVWPTPWDMFLMMSCGFIAAVGLTLLTQAYRVAQSSVVAPFEFTFAFWGILWGWLFWGDLPDALGWAGIGVIIAAGVNVLRSEGVSQTKP